MEERFNFWIPAELTKAESKIPGGKVRRQLKGVASTPDRDLDGEVLMPSGFDLSIFKNQGVINWHHMQKNKPSAIIGEPSSAVVKAEGKELHIVCDLYDTPLANEVYDLAEVLEKQSKNRRLGFSIEGTALERDPLDKTKVTKAMITGCAVTYLPKNKKTLAEIVKGEDFLNLDPQVSETFNEDLTNFQAEKGYEPTLLKSVTGDLMEDDKDLKVDIEEEDEEELEKMLDTTNSSALMKESVDKKPIDQLTKGQILDKIFDKFVDVDIVKAQRVYELIEKCSENMKITDSSIEKAFELLATSAEQLEKAETEAAKYKLDKSTGYYTCEGCDGKYFYKNDDGSFEEIEREEEDEEPEEKIEKGLLGDSTDELLKAVELIGKTQDKKFSAFSEILKSVHGRQVEQDELIKSLQSQLEQPAMGRKSLQRTPILEKAFGVEQTSSTGSDQRVVLSVKANKNQILNLLEDCSFTGNGVNQEFAKAMTTYESSGQIMPNIIAKLAKEKNVILVD